MWLLVLWPIIHYNMAIRHIFDFIPSKLLFSYEEHGVLLPPGIICRIHWQKIVSIFSYIWDVDSVVRCLHYLYWGEGSLAVLIKLDFILHVLELHVNRSVNLNRFLQGLPECLDTRRSNFPVPLHEVIHEALGSDAVGPQVLMFFFGEVGFLYCRDDILFEGGIYILINIVDPPLLLVYRVLVGLHRCCVAGPMLCTGPRLRRSCVYHCGQVCIHSCVHEKPEIAPPLPLGVIGMASAFIYSTSLRSFMAL